MSKLLIEEEPLQVLPTLAKAIGVNHAIVLQQIHYWLNKKLHFYDGKFWTYNSYEEWTHQFRHLTSRGLRNILTQLESMGLVMSHNYNKNKFDHTKWYTINYELLDSYLPDSPIDVANFDASDVANFDASLNTKNTENNKTYIGEFENVGLTDKEKEKIISKYGEDLTDRLIDRLSAYLKSNPKKAQQYKSHYSVLIGWVMSNVLENNPPKSLTMEQYRNCEKKLSSIGSKYQFNQANGKFYLK